MVILEHKKRRIGIMGGTFDPIHNGHLVAASEAASLFNLNEVIFVPSGQPWHKKDRIDQVSKSEDRYLMTVLATTSNPQFSVSRVDIERKKQTYTVDTLCDLHTLYPDDELFFITGVDALNSILSWQDWEILFDLAHFVGVSRPGFKVGEGNLLRLPKDKLTLVEVPAMAISSTDCRQRTREGRPIWYLMPDVVVRYIAKKGLYLPRDKHIEHCVAKEISGSV